MDDVIIEQHDGGGIVSFFVCLCFVLGLLHHVDYFFTPFLSTYSLYTAIVLITSKGP